jgi:Iap family predicted aminopeptidase
MTTGIRPDISDEDVGMRSWHIQRKKAVERAVEKIRHKLNANWKDIKTEDIDVLNWILSEIWGFVGRKEWEDFSFSGLSLPDVLKIIRIGKQVMNHEKSGHNGFEEVRIILSPSPV